MALVLKFLGTPGYWENGKQATLAFRITQLLRDWRRAF
jgi:hypothetical protein